MVQYPVARLEYRRAVDRHERRRRRRRVHQCIHLSLVHNVHRVHHLGVRQPFHALAGRQIDDRNPELWILPPQPLCDVREHFPPRGLQHMTVGGNARHGNHHRIPPGRACADRRHRGHPRAQQARAPRRRGHRRRQEQAPTRAPADRWLFVEEHGCIRGRGRVSSSTRRCCCVSSSSGSARRFRQSATNTWQFSGSWTRARRNARNGRQGVILYMNMAAVIHCALYSTVPVRTRVERWNGGTVRPDQSAQKACPHRSSPPPLPLSPALSRSLPLSPALSHQTYNPKYHTP